MRSIIARGVWDRVARPAKASVSRRLSSAALFREAKAFALRKHGEHRGMGGNGNPVDAFLRAKSRALARH